MTESIEPDLSSTVPERPCTVVLAQDGPFCYNNYNQVNDWKETFARILPQECGIHYCNLSLMPTNNDDSDDCCVTTLQHGLDVLRIDLTTTTTTTMTSNVTLSPNVILVARGPIISLVAQYYVESLSLAGLVLVDPLLLHHVSEWKNLGRLMVERSASTRHRHVRSQQQQQHQEFIKRITTGKETRSLKLEPGAVPVLIFSSIQDTDFQQAAHDVAFRHEGCSPSSDDDDDGSTFGTIPVHHITPDEPPAVVIDILTEWIDDCVL